MIEGVEVINGYEVEIKKNNPLLYEPAKILYDCICEKPYNSPFEARRVLIKTFKKLDELLVSHGAEPLKLHEKLIVNFIPSKRQLQLKVCQVFNAHTNSNNDLLITGKSDGQLCFLYENGNSDSLKDELKDLEDMTVEEFLTGAYKDYIVRD